MAPTTMTEVVTYRWYLSTKPAPDEDESKYFDMLKSFRGLEEIEMQNRNMFILHATDDAIEELKFQSWVIDLVPAAEALSTYQMKIKPEYMNESLSAYLRKLRYSIDEFLMSKDIPRINRIGDSYIFTCTQRGKSFLMSKDFLQNPIEVVNG